MTRLVTMHDELM